MLKKLRDSKSEVVQLELFTNRFKAIALEMGEMLRRTAISTNVKERLDFSCAILDPAGELVVNAPHMPVHLGALGLCVRSVRKVVSMEEGDVIVTNHPAYGGSHLPDITVITPVFSKKQTMLGYVANRAHHAEVGGARPGSMPPQATTLAEEGVVIRPFHLVRGGVADWEKMETLLASGPYPSRAIADNLADLRAAVASNHRGVVALQKLTQGYDKDTVLRYMSELKRMAEIRIRDALDRLPDGKYSALEYLDDGAPLAVQIKISGDAATIDFEGSAEVHPGNLNANSAIVRSAVIYILRLLIDEPLPLNEGLMRPVSIRIPEGFLNPDFNKPPEEAPAVVGGNVETSQRLVNTMLKALRLMAGSQGTMNNTLFGTEEFGYYETVCGGCGAGPDFDGADAVHSHMTNTRITDPEVLENRYPVRVERMGEYEALNYEKVAMCDPAIRAG
ncbi:hydantoinase B/oxoprolinase family protein, partial [bacterium]|nr:hydantoinase B/oxoprolinase family protein [bacterium]